MSETRPKGHPPIWASDAAYDDAGADWHETPNKTRPADGFIAQGYLPERRRPANYDNWLFGDLTRRVAALVKAMQK